MIIIDLKIIIMNVTKREVDEEEEVDVD